MLCQHLGVAPEEGAYMYSRDKMSDPAYKPPLRFRLALRLQNGGRICGTLRVPASGQQALVVGVVPPTTAW